MSMHYCKIVKFQNGRVKKVLAIVDVNQYGTEIKTYVQAPYASVLKNLHMGGIEAMQSHPDIKTAIRFHKSMASELHHGTTH